MTKLKIKKQSSIILYDFDNTIYRGDSSIDFYLYCLKNNWNLFKYFPKQLVHYLLFKLKIENRTIFKSNFFMFLAELEDVTQSVESFWDNNSKKIQNWYAEKDHSRDVIISASPDFLLAPLFSRFNIYTLIATEMNPLNGIIIGKNCYGDEKVNRLHRKIPNAIVEEVYSDHASDIPILGLSDRAFVVIGTKIFSLQEFNKLTKLKVLKIKLLQNLKNIVFIRSNN